MISDHSLMLRIFDPFWYLGWLVSRLYDTGFVVICHLTHNRTVSGAAKLGIDDDENVSPLDDENKPWSCWEASGLCSTDCEPCEVCVCLIMILLFQIIFLTMRCLNQNKMVGNHLSWARDLLFLYQNKPDQSGRSPAKKGWLLKRFSLYLTFNDWNISELFVSWKCESPIGR